MKIAIRADGGSIIGMGHVMRCLTLAKELRKEHDVFFVCRIDKGCTSKYLPGINLITENKFQIKIINENNLTEEIKKIKADCIITDSYDVDENYFNVLKDNFRISGCFDDEKICNYFNVDFIINQNIYAKNLNYIVNENTKLLLGTKFAILRSEFRNSNYKKYINKDIKNIMITVGGSDNNNITESLIKQFLNQNYILHIVIGQGFNNIYTLKKYENENVKLYFNSNMKILMYKVDICISSCGTTIYELASCVTPIIGIVVAENQELMAKVMDEKKLIKFSNKDEVLQNIKYLNYEVRKEVSQSLKKVVDGQGVYRVINEINSLLKDG